MQILHQIQQADSKTIYYSVTLSHCMFSYNFSILILFIIEVIQEDATDGISRTYFIQCLIFPIHDLKFLLNSNTVQIRLHLLIRNSIYLKYP